MSWGGARVIQLSPWQDVTGKPRCLRQLSWKWQAEHGSFLFVLGFPCGPVPRVRLGGSCPPGPLPGLSLVWASLPSGLAGCGLCFYSWNTLQCFLEVIPACQQLHFLISHSFISLKAKNQMASQLNSTKDLEESTPILWGHQHPKPNTKHTNTKTRQRCHKKRKLQANITDEHKCKNP